MWAVTLKGSVNATLLLGASVDIDLSFDDNGNVGFQWSYSVPTVNDTISIGLADLGVAVQLQAMWGVDTIKDLEGRACYFGASGGYLGYLGGDVILSGNMESTNGKGLEEIDGVQIQGGAGVGADVHGTESYTSTLKMWHIEGLENFFDIFSKKEDKCEISK